MTVKRAAKGRAQPARAPASSARSRGVTSKQALAFVKKHGVVLQAARGAVPSLAEFIAGAVIRGSWWSHPKGREIFRVCEALAESEDVLTCTLVDGKVTYVHKRLWPALVKLADRFPKSRLAKSWQEHTASGAHQKRRVPFPKWVPAAVVVRAAKLSEARAQRELAAVLGER